MELPIRLLTTMVIPFKKNDILISEFVRRKKKWKPQDKYLNCVVVIMEYVMEINGNLKKDRDWFTEEYRHIYGMIVKNYGVYSGNMNVFLEKFFVTYPVNSPTQFQLAIKNGNCIMATINNDVGLHEILIVGYSPSRNDYIYIDPGTDMYGIAPLVHFNNYQIIRIR